MGDGEDPNKNPEAHGLLTGLVAVLVLLGWLALASAGYRRSIWTAANIMATTFYGEAGIALYYLSFALLIPLYTHRGLWGRLLTCRPIVNRPWP